MKKIVSALLVVMLVFGMLPVFASAAEVTATLSFASTAQRVSQDNNSQVWAQNGITFTNNKAASGSNVANYSNPVRLYASSDVIIEYPGMTKIEIAVNASKYVSPLTSSSFSSGTVTSSGNTVTIVFAAPTDSLTITKLTGQTRFNSLTVTAVESSGDTTCEHTNVVENADGKAATCTETGLTNSFSCADCGETVTYQQVIDALGHNVVDGVCTRCGEEQVLYDLVTDVAELTVGSQVVIVAAEYDTALSIIQANNNRQETAIEKTGTQVIMNDNVQVLTVGTGTVVNTYSFHTGEGYLYAAGADTNNYLRTKTDLDGTASFAVGISAEGIATVQAHGVLRGFMRYNDNNKIFSCYASGQKDISIYKLAGTGNEPVECTHPTSSVQDDAKEATCTSVGYTATEKCDACGAITKFAEEIPALGHSYVDYACSVCMAIDPASPLTATRLFEAPANGDKIVVYHYNSKKIMSATFNSYGERLVGVDSVVADGVLPYGASAAVLTVIVTEDGEYAFQFADGKYLASAEAGNALVLADELDDLSLWTVTALEAGAFNIVNNGATYNGTDYNQALECYSGNFTTYGLQSTAAFEIDLYLVEKYVCSHAQTVEQADGKAATCTEPGLTNSWICGECGETVVQQQTIDALGHTWDNGVYTDPTHEADGYTTYTCTVCGATETEIDEGSKLPEIVEPAIIKQPENVTAESGETVQFAVEAQGDVVSYKWEYRKIWKWFDTSMEGYNTNTLTVPVTGARNGYDYRCTITYADGTVLVTEPAELTAITYITDVVGPNDQTVVLGYKGQFTASAQGEGIKYQWQYKRPDGTQWIDTAMEGCTKPTVLIETTAARDGYQYRCEITDVTGNVVSYTEAATMRVLSFKAHPVETFAANGATATFTVQTSVEGGFTYQWQYSSNGGETWTNTAMAGYNTATLTVDATNARNGYLYRCELTGSKNSKIQSKPATLHVGDPVVITAQPQAVTVAAGEVATFTVEATNAYAYQWQYQNTTSTKWGNTSADGNQTATLNVTTKASNNGYKYRCVIYGLDGTETITEFAILTVG